ncbi:unnamed protein product [Trichogramma brassicae]|uniref:Peptidase S1 domain-containing protein n=1 Tax=Trichogramma brassicae TaxID=86971 RepID=A0A6H5IAS0_9HYME|nr:unnamed protein product [Trichogramma brassicae]
MQRCAFKLIDLVRIGAIFQQQSDDIFVTPFHSQVQQWIARIWPEAVGILAVLEEFLDGLAAVLDILLSFGKKSISRTIAAVLRTAIQWRQLRIVGGDVAKPGQFKYHVALETEKDRIYFCGGAIVSDRHIVTAAHCFVENGDFAWQDQRVQVVAGLFDLQERNSAVIRRVDKVYVPTRYMYNTNLSDIALLRVRRNRSDSLNKI